MKQFLAYTAARLGIFVAAFVLAAAVLWLATGRDVVHVLWPLVIAAVASSVISAYALRGLREDFAASVQARADRAVQNQSQNQSQNQAGGPGADRD